MWSPVWSENEHSRSAQDGWGQEENQGWGYGDIVFRETSKLYSTEMNNKSVKKKVLLKIRYSRNSKFNVIELNLHIVLTYAHK